MSATSLVGAISGRVLFDADPPPIRYRVPRIDSATCGDGPREDRSLVVDPVSRGVRFAVVTLTPQHGTVVPPAGEQPATIEEARCDFYPYVTLARPGASVTVVNTDPGLHDLHRLDPNGLGTHDPSPPGSRVALPFVRAGRTELGCDLHYWAKAWVVATDAPFATVTDGKGGFEFPKVPSGAWTLEVWHERLGEKTLGMTVEAGSTAHPRISLSLPLLPLPGGVVPR